MVCESCVQVYSSMWKCATVYWDIQKCTVAIWTTAVDWSSNVSNDVITNYIIPRQQCHHTCTLVNLLLLSASTSTRQTTALCIRLISTSWLPMCAALVASLNATDKTEIRAPHYTIIFLASCLANSTSSTTSTSVFVHMHAHICASATRDDYDHSYATIFKGQLHEETILLRNFYQHFGEDHTG